MNERLIIDAAKKNALKCLPYEVEKKLLGVVDRIEEIRIRADSPIIVHCDGRELIMDEVCDIKDIAAISIGLSGHSMHSISEETREGFFTVRGGIRVGLGGRVVCTGGGVSLMRSFTSLNIRFPSEKKGIAKDIIPCITDSGRVFNTLIISSPGAGKTTLLRDTVRVLSNGEYCRPYRCCVIDERGELFPKGFDRGIRTDVLEFCPKVCGFTMAIRALSPEIIAADEIGSEDEIDCIKDIINSGVSVIATAHSASTEELFRKRGFEKMLSCGLEKVVILSESKGKGTVEEIFDIGSIDAFTKERRFIS